MKTKINDHPAYINAVNVWTIGDPLKRKIAKENNLKYIEFWKFDEVVMWLENF